MFRGVLLLVSSVLKKLVYMARPAYEERTDLEKVQSQWHKLTGLHDRLESSAALIRAATAAELAANFAIREEFRKQSQFSSEFVDSLLMWANGLAGKMDKILIPATQDTKRSKKVKPLKAVAAAINKRRNAIAHQGNFADSDEAEEAIEQTRNFVETLVKIYSPEFRLKDQKKKNSKSQRG